MSTKNRSNTLTSSEVSDIEANGSLLSAQAYVGPNYFNDLAHGLSAKGRSVALRSIANSALYAAIVNVVDLLALQSDPSNEDELAVARLTERANKSCEQYTYYRAEAKTYAHGDTYNEAMNFSDMYKLVRNATPRVKDIAEAMQDPKVQRALGITPEEVAADRVRRTAIAKAQALHRYQIMATLENETYTYVVSVPPGTPDIEVREASRMLGKISDKLLAEKMRIFVNSDVIPGSLSLMTLLNDDFYKVIALRKELDDAHIGDSRVRAD